jgi:hypothetical protein
MQRTALGSSFTTRKDARALPGLAAKTHAILRPSSTLSQRENLLQSGHGTRSYDGSALMRAHLPKEMTMDYRVMLAIALVTIAPAALAQTRNAADESLKTHIAALDRQGWEAWKRNDPTWFENNTTENFVSISSDGTISKAEVVKSTATDCKVASFSLAGIKFVMLDKNAVLLTYTATQDAVCGGQQAPVILQVAVNYVRRGGKWLEAMYMQAP